MKVKELRDVLKNYNEKYKDKVKYRDTVNEDYKTIKEMI